MDGMQKARLILGFFDADPAAGAPASAVLKRCSEKGSGRMWNATGIRLSA